MSSRPRLAFLLRLLTCLVGICLLLLCATAATQWGSTTSTQTANTQDALFYNGQQYALNENLITILLIGNDENKSNQDSEYSGQCDALVLAVIDTEAATLQLFNIPRDTLASVIVQDLAGSFLREEIQQIALSYAYGVDDADACALTAQAVSTLLYNIPIDYYACLDLSGIATANDLIGGVTLTLLEDFTDLAYASYQNDPTMIEGETLTLTGEQAYLYVQYRNVWEETSSAQRIARQSQYLSAYIAKATATIQENPFVVVSYYKALQEYLFTDLPLAQIIQLASLAGDLQFSAENVTTLTGSSEVVDGYLALTLDQDALLALVLETFYTVLSPE